MVEKEFGPAVQRRTVFINTLSESSLIGNGRSESTAPTISIDEMRTMPAGAFSEAETTPRNTTLVSMRMPLSCWNASSPMRSSFPTHWMLLLNHEARQSGVVAASLSLDPALQFNLFAVKMTLLHIADPCGLDHALTKVSHPPCLCECLPRYTSEVGGSGAVSCKVSKRSKWR